MNKSPLLRGLLFFFWGGGWWLCHKDKTDFTRFLSVSVLFATKKHRFPKKLSTIGIFAFNCLIFHHFFLFPFTRKAQVCTNLYSSSPDTSC
jgi:hypothetical protein